MLFPSLEFLFLFLPASLALYYAAPGGRAKNAVLLVVSLAFYLWGGGGFVFLLLASMAVAYVGGRLVAAARARERTAAARAVLLAAVAANLGLLVYFKYSEWLLDQFSGAFGFVGLGRPVLPSVALPLGISFFTFQSMSYVIDVWRGRTKPERDVLDFAMYMALFPHLLAGPIVRYRVVSRQLRDRTHSVDEFGAGVIRFVHGLAKKVIVADTLARVVDAAYSLPGDDLTFAAAWIGTIAFSIQLYFDFSGYSDMAIGLGQMFGFRLPENFVRPHSAVSISDFWQRWNITLSSWFRDYLYTPLRGRGDNRVRVLGGLFLTFVLVGVWHGAALTFVAFGAIHGAALVVERVTGNDKSGPNVTNVVPRRIVTMLVLMLSIPFFRASSVTSALRQVRAMALPASLDIPDVLGAALTHQAVLVLVLASVIFFLPRTLVLGRRVAESAGWAPAVARLALIAVALPYTTALVATPGQNPFIYFRF